MDRFWLKSYPPGVPSDIDPSIYPSVVALLEESFSKYRDQRAYVCMDKALTFGEIDTLSLALAAWLQSRGLPTSDPRELDVDVILAAQALNLGVPANDLVVATTNVRHLSRFLDARLWTE